MNASTENLIPRRQYLSIAQKALATSARRAETLFADGYTVEPYADRPGVYSVARPVNDPRPMQKGETLWNDVDVCNQDCTCEGFRFRRMCKHLIATNKAIAEAARLMGPMLPAPQVDTAWPPIDRAEKTAFSGYGSDAWKKKVAADFG